MTKLILIRHGQTAANLKKQYQGHLDFCLDETGLKQAQALAQELPKLYQIEAIITSPLQRAVQTANEIAKPFGLEPQTHEGLKELDFGIWDGLTYNEIALKYPISKWIENPASYNIPNGELWANFSGRIRQAFKEITALPYKTIAVISHAGVIRNHLSGIMGLKGLDAFKFQLSNCGFSELISQENKYKVTFINSNNHI